MAVSQGHQNAKYLSARDEFFDPRRDPLLKPGYVNDDFTIGGEDSKISAAKSLKAYRDAHYGWRLAADMDSRTLKRIRRGLQEWVAAQKKAWALRRKRAADFNHPLPPIPYPPSLPQRFDAGTAVTRVNDALALKPLPFYRDSYLIHIPGGRFGAVRAERFVFARNRSGHIHVQRLDGSSAPMHDLNALTISFSAKGSLQEYLTFFCRHLRAAGGCFHIAENKLGDGTQDALEALHEISLADLAPYHPESSGKQPPQPHVDAQVAHPIILLSKGAVAKLIATVIYSGRAWRSAFTVSSEGMVDMKSDSALPQGSVPALALSWHPDEGKGR